MSQARKMMAYINGNDYFNGLKEISKENAELKIKENQGLINQIDDLILGYSKNLAQKDNTAIDRTVFLDNESSLDIPTLLSLKNTLIKENESKKIELLQQNEAIKIINFGQAQKVKRPLFGERLVKFPLILVGAFLLVSLILYLNRKSIEKPL